MSNTYSDVLRARHRGERAVKNTADAVPGLTNLMQPSNEVPKQYLGTVIKAVQAAMKT